MGLIGRPPGRWKNSSIETFFAELRSSKVPRSTYQASMGEALPDGSDHSITKGLDKFREYMAAVMAALKLPPDAAKARLEMLGTQKRTLNALTQRLIPSPQKVNESRAEVSCCSKGIVGSAWRKVGSPLASKACMLGFTTS